MYTKPPHLFIKSNFIYMIMHIWTVVYFLCFIIYELKRCIQYIKNYLLRILKINSFSDCCHLILSKISHFTCCDISNASYTLYILDLER